MILRRTAIAAALAGVLLMTASCGGSDEDVFASDSPAASPPGDLVPTLTSELTRERVREGLAEAPEGYAEVQPPRLERDGQTSGCDEHLKEMTGQYAPDGDLDLHVTYQNTNGTLLSHRLLSYGSPDVASNIFNLTFSAMKNCDDGEVQVDGVPFSTDFIQVPGVGSNSAYFRLTPVEDGVSASSFIVHTSLLGELVQTVIHGGPDGGDTELVQKAAAGAADMFFRG